MKVCGVQNALNFITVYEKKIFFQNIFFLSLRNKSTSLKLL